MDFAELKQKLDAARELAVSVAGIKFRLRQPTEHAWRLAREQHSGNAAAISRAMLEPSITGWEGLQAEHLLKGAGDDQIAFSAEARNALLDERPDIADELTIALVDRLNKRRQELGAARKNSARASSGT